MISCLLILVLSPVLFGAAFSGTPAPLFSCPRYIHSRILKSWMRSRSGCKQPSKTDHGFPAFISSLHPAFRNHVSRCPAAGFSGGGRTHFPRFLGISSDAGQGISPGKSVVPDPAPFPVPGGMRSPFKKEGCQLVRKGGNIPPLNFIKEKRCCKILLPRIFLASSAETIP